MSGFGYNAKLRKKSVELQKTIKKNSVSTLIFYHFHSESIEAPFSVI